MVRDILDYSWWVAPASNGTNIWGNSRSGRFVPVGTRRPAAAATRNAEAVDRFRQRHKLTSTEGVFIMIRKLWLALLALILVTPAAAQLTVQPDQRPIRIQPIPVPEVMPPNSDIAEKVMTIEEARARISQLIREKREANAKLTEALTTIEQMTKRGGSLVRAFCEGNVSRNTAGGSEDCGRYACGDSSGLCKTSCSASPDCSTGYSCDGGQCMTLAEIQARTPS
jgi:hypothetical protein